MSFKNKMYKMMISCDKATYYSDISQYKKLSLVGQIKFITHLVSCKPCSDYHKQNKILSEKIKKVSTSNTTEIRLSEDKKVEIKNEIEKNI